MTNTILGLLRSYTVAILAQADMNSPSVEIDDGSGHQAMREPLIPQFAGGGGKSADSYLMTYHR